MTGRRPSIGILFACIFVDLLGFGIIIPLLPFMALRLGASPQEVTFLIATYSAALLIAGPLWGRLSDRWGRKPVLLISFVGTASAFTIMAFADQFWMLFVARALAGFLSGDLAAAPAYAADVSTPEKRAKAMGMLGAAFGLAFTIGPGIGATLAGSEPDDAAFRTIPLISAGLSCATLILAALFLPESNPPTKRETASQAAGRPAVTMAATIIASLRFRHMGLVVLIVFLISVVFAAMESTLPLWAETVMAWGPQQVGYLFVFAGIVAVICQGGLIGPLSRRFGEVRLVLAAAILLGLGMVGIAAADGLALLLFAVACLSAGFGLGNPALQSLISRLCPVETTGGALGVGQATSSFARVLGPPTAGFLFQTLNPAAPYLAGGLVMVLAAGLAIHLRQRLAGDDRPILAKS